MPAASGPYETFNFQVSIEGVPAADFSECILPVVTIDAVEYREGSDTFNNVHKLPGLTKYGNLVLKRGIPSGTAALAIWNWFSTFVAGTGRPVPMTVTLLDAARRPLIKWSFTNAWPAKYESPALNGQTSAVAIETLEVVVEGMTVTNLAAGG